MVWQDDRLEDDWVPQNDGRSLEEIEKETRQREAENRAVVLEMIGDLPEADAKPPSNMLFVCKLNPVTTEEVRADRLGSSLYATCLVDEMGFQRATNSSCMFYKWMKIAALQPVHH